MVRASIIGAALALVAFAIWTVDRLNRLEALQADDRVSFYVEMQPYDARLKAIEARQAESAPNERVVHNPAKPPAEPAQQGATMIINNGASTATFTSMARCQAVASKMASDAAEADRTTREMNNRAIAEASQRGTVPGVILGNPMTTTGRCVAN